MLGNACILELEDLAGAKFLLPNFLQMANSTFGRCSVGFMVVLPAMSSYFINANVRTNCARAFGSLKSMQPAEILFHYFQRFSR